MYVLHPIFLHDRYNSKGCGRSYLSKRDLDAHIAYRHVDKTILPTVLTGTASIPQMISPFFPPPPPPPPPPAGAADMSGQVIDIITYCIPLLGGCYDYDGPLNW